MLADAHPRLKHTYTHTNKHKVKTITLSPLLTSQLMRHLIKYFVILFPLPAASVSKCVQDTRYMRAA